MDNEQFRILKHDLKSDLGSIFSAINMLSNSEDLNESRTVLKLILDKEVKVMENLEALIEKASS